MTMKKTWKLIGMRPQFCAGLRFIWQEICRRGYSRHVELIEFPVILWQHFIKTCHWLCPSNITQCQTSFLFRERNCNWWQSRIVTMHISLQSWWDWQVSIHQLHPITVGTLPGMKLCPYWQGSIFNQWLHHHQCEIRPYSSASRPCKFLANAG